MTTPTAVARAVARDAEQRARAALDDVLAAHTTLRAADTALATAVQAQAAAGPALARPSPPPWTPASPPTTSPTSASPPRPRAPFDAAPTHPDPEPRTPRHQQRTPNEPTGGHQRHRGRSPVLAVVATTAHAAAASNPDPAWPDQDAATGHDSAPYLDHHGHPARPVHGDRPGHPWPPAPPMTTPARLWAHRGGCHLRCWPTWSTGAGEPTR